MRIAMGVGLLLLMSCQRFQSRIIVPPIVETLDAPMLQGTMAIRTLGDSRPTEERGDDFVEHAMGLSLIHI